jgi:hypothetical protein
MTRSDLLKLLIGRARTNGFEFRRWYKERLGIPWINAEAAVKVLESQRRYYALLFSRDFAQAFWKAGEPITFQVEAQTFQRVMPDGTAITVNRKPFMRRSSRREAWRYHLREMALADEPLRYIRKYLAVEEELDDSPTPPERVELKPAARKTSRALPKDLPRFLQRPYKTSKG